MVAGPLHVQSEGISFTSRRSIFQATGAAAAGDQAADKSQEQIINSGMVLPFDPLSLSFSHVHYYVPLPRHQVTLLTATTPHGQQRLLFPGDLGGAVKL